MEGDRLIGIRTGDKGSRQGRQTERELRAGHRHSRQITILAEGVRGSLTKQLIQRLRLDEGRTRRFTRSA